MTHKSQVLLPIHLGPLDLSITTPTFWSFVATILLVIFLLLAIRKLTLIPSGLQNVLELAIEFVENQIIKPSGLEGKTWTPFILSIFLYILFNDWIGIIPGATPATSNINETAALAISVFILSLFLRLKRTGLNFFKSLLPEGVSGPIAIILLPIEIIGQIIKPVSLAIRLFANMSGGHLLVLTIIGFTTLFGNIAVSLISVGGTFVIILFEIFVGFIQAYVFAFLSALLLGESLAEEH